MGLIRFNACGWKLERDARFGAGGLLEEVEQAFTFRAGRIAQQQERLGTVEVVQSRSLVGHGMGRR